MGQRRGPRGGGIGGEEGEGLGGGVKESLESFDLEIVWIFLRGSW